MSHAVEGPCTPLANPVATLAAHDGARLLARSLTDAPDREGLALGALLAGYVIDSTGYGLHHVLSQTLVRLARRRPRARQRGDALPHGRARSRGASRSGIDALGVALDGDPADVAARMCRLRRRDAAARPRRRARRAGRVRGGGGGAARARPHAAARRPGRAAGTLRGGMVNDGLKAAEEKMRDAGVPDAAIATFAHYYEQLESGETGMLADDDLDQLSDVPVVRRPARRGRPRGARQGRDRQAQRRARDEHGHGAGEVAARGQGGQDLPRHHRRPGARAAQGARRAAAARAHELVLHARRHAGGAREAPRARVGHPRRLRAEQGAEDHGRGPLPDRVARRPRPRVVPAGARRRLHGAEDLGDARTRCSSAATSTRSSPTPTTSARCSTRAC